MNPGKKGTARVILPDAVHPDGCGQRCPFIVFLIRFLFHQGRSTATEREYTDTAVFSAVFFRPGGSIGPFWNDTVPITDFKDANRQGNGPGDTKLHMACAQKNNTIGGAGFE